MGYIIYSVSEMCMKKSLLRINHPDIEDLSYWCCAYKKILHKNAVCLFGQNKLYILKQQFVLSKIILCAELQVLTHFDTH